MRIVGPPKDLKPDAAKRWRAVYPQLARRGGVDLEELHAYCQVWARWRQAENAVAASGPLTKTPTGRIVASPMVEIANKTAAHVRAIEERLGLGRREPSAPTGPTDRQDDGETPVTRKELAERLHCHMQSITIWERQGLPVFERGRRGRPSRYLESQVRAWKDAREQAAKPPGHVDVAQERARKERAQAILAEQTYQARSRELLPAVDVERVWAQEVQAVRTAILATYTTAADRVHRAAVLDGVPGVEAAMKEIAYELLRELARPDREPPPAPVPTAPEAGQPA